MKKLLEENPNTGTYWDNVFKKEINHNIDRVALNRFEMIADIIPENSSVLDLGCGKGELLKYLDKYKFNIKCFGCDVSRVAIGYCQKQMPNYKFKTCDVKDLSHHYRENEFDYIVCEEVFEHIDEPEKLVEDIYRILKKGGTLIISTPYKNSIIGEHIWSFAMKDFVNMFENNKWDIEEIKRYYNLRNLFITVIKQ